VEKKAIASVSVDVGGDLSVSYDGNGSGSIDFTSRNMTFTDPGILGLAAKRLAQSDSDIQRRITSHSQETDPIPSAAVGGTINGVPFKTNVSELHYDASTTVEDGLPVFKFSVTTDVTIDTTAKPVDVSYGVEMEAKLVPVPQHPVPSEPHITLPNIDPKLILAVATGAVVADVLADLIARVVSAQSGLAVAVR
jgi:hypothetical protein